MLTEKQISKIIYYTAGILGCVPLAVIYIVLGNETAFYVLIALISTLFGVPLALNEIPHWVLELKNIAPTTGAVVPEPEEENFFTALDKRLLQVDEQLKEKVEADQGVVPGIVIEERAPTESDLSFLGSLGASTKKE